MWNYVSIVHWALGGIGWLISGGSHFTLRKTCKLSDTQNNSESDDEDWSVSATGNRTSAIHIMILLLLAERS
jgi:hypothetical protein